MFFKKNTDDLQKSTSTTVEDVEPLHTFDSAEDDTVILDALPPSSSAPGGRGVFINEKPPMVTAVKKPSLFAKFATKNSAKAFEPSPLFHVEDAEISAENKAVGPTEDVATPIVVSRVSDKKKPSERPIRVLIGYLAEVSEREAREYALGVAERNCQQISMVYFDAFKYGEGCVYEIQEGGSGRAYTPEIIKYFENKGAYRNEGANAESVFIATATRTVQVSRTAEGLQAFILPESSTELPTGWLQGSTKMSPALPTYVGVLVAGAALFIAGFLGLALSMAARIQPYDAPVTPKIENVVDSFSSSPLSRWSALQSVSGDEYVKAVRFSKGKWDIQRGSATEKESSTSSELDAIANTGSTNPVIK